MVIRRTPFILSKDDDERKNTTVLTKKISRTSESNESNAEHAVLYKVMRNYPSVKVRYYIMFKYYLLVKIQVTHTNST